VLSLLALAAAIVIGHSVQGRPIDALEVGYPASPHRVLVVGCIHGNECAALPVVRLLERSQPTFDLWLVPNVNPDGFARGTRQNAHGVDLNRNWGAMWEPIGRRGSPQWSGPRPWSEPETKAALALVERLRPDVTIWFHQPQDVVRAWGPAIPAARRFARDSGLPFRRLAWLPGSATNWMNRRFKGTSTYVVELPAGPASPAFVARLAAAVLRQ
jgi:protein MpaA